MTQDIKDIALMMGTQFADAVKLAEKREAEEIESILKTVDEAFKIFLEKTRQTKARRTELLLELTKCHDDEEAAATIYQDQVQEIWERLERYRRTKLGSQDSDLARTHRTNSFGEAKHT